MSSSDPMAREEFAEAAAELLELTYARSQVAEEVEAYGFSRTAWSAIADGGWFALLLDEELGGLGAGIAELTGLFTAAGVSLAAGPLVETAVLAPMLSNGADTTTRARLEAVLAGERLLALVDAAALSADAAPVAWRDGRVIGALDLVRFGTVADELVVVARGTDGAELIALVTAADASIEPQESVDPATVYARVQLDGAPADVVGQSDLLLELRSVIRLMLAHELSGLAGKVTEMSVEYAKVREQFGQAIGAFQAVAHLLAETYAHVHSLKMHCLWALPDDTEPADELAALALKAHAAAVARQACETAFQVHGGIAFTMEHPMHRYYKHTLALQGLYGDERELALELGRGLLSSREVHA